MNEVWARVCAIRNTKPVRCYFVVINDIVEQLKSTITFCTHQETGAVTTTTGPGFLLPGRDPK